MKIWIFNHYAGSIEYGMEFRHFYFAKELLKLGCEVTIFAGAYSHLRKYNPEVKGDFFCEKHEGISYVWIPTRNYEGNGVKRALSMLDYYKNVISVCNKFESPDIIFASSPHPFACLAALKAAKKHNCKCISEVRDLWPEALIYYKGLSPKSPIVKVLEKYEHKIYKKSDALIFTKPGDTDYLKEKKWLDICGGDVLFEKCHYINNGVDLADYEKQKAENIYQTNSNCSQKFVVTYVGTIREVNNIDMLLDAAKQLKESSNIVFEIFGDGEELERLQKRREDENITNINFEGRVDKKFIPNILSRSSVNILNYSPALYNWSRGNSSNKLFEYMACGRPIISTVKMGYSPIEKYECGIEIENCTGEKLADAILNLKSSSESQISKMGVNAYNASKEFDYPKLTEKLLCVFKNTINAKG